MNSANLWNTCFFFNLPNLISPFGCCVDTNRHIQTLSLSDNTHTQQQHFAAAAAVRLIKEQNNTRRLSVSFLWQIYFLFVSCC